MTTTEIITLLISVIAVAISAVSLGWNIYRDVIIKPKMKLKLSFANLINGLHGDSPGLLTNINIIRDNNTFIILEAVNHGPGKISCRAIILEMEDGRLAIADADISNPVTDKLPKTLEVGECLKTAYPILHNGFLSMPLSRIGIRDSFDRVHWTSTNNISVMKNVFSNYFKQ